MVCYMDYDKRTVAFFDGSDLKLVFCDEETKNKLSVRSDRGRQFRIPVKTVFKVLGKGDYNSFVAGHDSMLADVELEKLDIDTTLLWEMLQEDLKDYSTDELADFYGETDDISCLALFAALVDDAVRFKRKGVSFAPRSAVQVEEQLQIIRKKQEKEAFRQRAIPWLKEVLKQPNVDSVPEEFRPFLNLLEVFLSNRKDNEASRILASVIGDRSLKEAVYDILMKCGVIDESSDRFLVLAGISEQFSVRVEEEAAKLNEAKDLDTREDLTHLNVFSIDDTDTMDIDDALSVERLEDGFRVGVHITDVSASVFQGDSLDDEALNRVTSIYLPDRTVNMFPKTLSHEVCSLVAGEDRAAMSFMVNFDNNFEQTEFQVKLSKVNVAEKLSYSNADELLNGDSELGQQLRDLQEIANHLQSERVEKGAAIFNRPELKIQVSEEVPSVKIMDRNSPSRFLVSEFMILANFIAARYSAHHDVPIIYRVQDAPENLPEIDPEVYDPVLFEQAIKCMKKSRLSLHPQSHGGLGADFYTQLTSPIRRYTDLVMQRQLAAYLNKSELPYEPKKLMEVIAAAESINAEVREVQRQAENYWLHLYCEQNLMGESLDATVISKAPGGYMIEIDAIVLKTRLSTQDKLKNGSRIQVLVEKVKPKKGFIQLSLVQS